MAESNERRLHPLSWVFTAAQFAKGFIVPFFLLIFASGGASYELWAAVFIVPAAFGAVVKYVVFRYRFASDEMVVCDGILTRTERHIPYARIQNIDLVQNPLHRFFQVAMVRVETASGSKPEAVMRVLSLDAVTEMRVRVFAGRHEAASAARSGGQEMDSAAADSDILLRLPPLEIVKLGVVSDKGLVVVGAATLLYWQRAGWAGNTGELVELYLASAMSWAPDLALESPVLTGLLVGVTLLIIAVVLLRAFSIGWFFLKLYGFTLSRRGNDLRAEYGLFTRVSRTIPTSHIQSLKSTETPLHRAFGRQSVEMRTVGASATDVPADFGGQQGMPKAERQWLAPMVETVRLPGLLRDVHEQVALDDVEWTPIARRAWRRVFRRWLVVVAVLTVLVGVVVDLWALALGLPAVLLAYAHAHLYVRHAGYALTSWGLLCRNGWWTRTLTLVHYGNIQTVALDESPFDRRNDMASVRVDTAGAESERHTIAIPYLDQAVAVDVTRRLYDEANRRAFHW